MTRVITILVSLITFTLPAQSGWEEAEDLQAYQSVLAKARSSGKKLFVVLFNERDSAWQQMQKENIFEHPSVHAALQNYTTLAIPVKSEMGSRWVQLFPAGDIPAFYFLDNDEFLYLIEEGYLDSSDMASAAAKASRRMTEFENLRDLYSRGELNTAQWKELLAVHSLNFPFEKTMTLAMEFLGRFKSDRELLQKEVLPVLITYGIDLQTPYPSRIITNRKEVQSRMENFSFEDYFANVYSYNFDLAVHSEDSIFLEKLVTEIIPHNPDSLTSARELTYETRKLYAEQTGQLNIWGKGIREYAQEIKDEERKAEAIFDVAYIMADEYNSDLALRTARNLAGRASAIHADFRYSMLEAYMNYLLKEYEQAEELVRKAATLSDNPNNLRKAESLLKMILEEKEEAAPSGDTGE